MKKYNVLVNGSFWAVIEAAGDDEAAAYAADHFGEVDLVPVEDESESLLEYA